MRVHAHMRVRATCRAGLAPGLYARSLLNRSHSPRSSGRRRTSAHGCACCTSSPNGDFLIFSCGIIACEKHNRIRIGVAWPVFRMAQCNKQHAVRALHHQLAVTMRLNRCIGFEQLAARCGARRRYIEPNHADGMTRR